jgi:hypothetical protein
MLSGKRCSFEHPDGRSCGPPPLRSGKFCYWHAPEKGEEAAEARRLGGLRRRREKMVARAYDITGLDSVDNIRRVLKIAALDALGLVNSVARTRVLIAGALAAARLLEAASFGSFSLEVAEET